MLRRDPSSSSRCSSDLGHPIGIQSLQPRDRERTDRVAPSCQGIRGRGGSLQSFLTGQIKSRADFDGDDWRKDNPKFSDENFPKNIELVHALQRIAERKGCTSGQISLAWLLAQDQLVIPIPGTKKEKYYKENMGALDIKLTKEELEGIRREIEKVEIIGHRYSEANRGNLYVDTVPL